MPDDRLHLIDVVGFETSHPEVTYEYVHKAYVGYQIRFSVPLGDNRFRGLALTIGTESGRDWTVALRRQHARTAEGQPTGCYTNAFEIICRGCGDDASRDYNNVPPRLQRIRGPYEFDAGLTVNQAHSPGTKSWPTPGSRGAGRGPSLNGHRAPLGRTDEADLSSLTTVIDASGRRAE